MVYQTRLSSGGSCSDRFEQPACKPLFLAMVSLIGNNDGPKAGGEAGKSQTPNARNNRQLFNVRSSVENDNTSEAKAKNVQPNKQKKETKPLCKFGALCKYGDKCKWQHIRCSVKNCRRPAENVQGGILAACKLHVEDVKGGDPDMARTDFFVDDGVPHTDRDELEGTKQLLLNRLKLYSHDKQVCEAIRTELDEIEGKLDAVEELRVANEINAKLNKIEDAELKEHFSKIVQPVRLDGFLDMGVESFDEIIEAHKNRMDPAWAKFKDMVYAHYATAKTIESADLSAKARYPIWMTKAGIKHEDDEMRKCLEIIAEISNEDWSPFGTWKHTWMRFKLKFIRWLCAKWWIAFLPLILTVLAVSLMGTKKQMAFALVVLSAGYKFIKDYIKKQNMIVTTDIPQDGIIEDWCTFENDANFEVFKDRKEGDNELKIAEFLPNQKNLCQCRQYLVGFTTAYYSIYIPRNCIHNHVRCMVNRQLLPPIKFEGVYLTLDGLTLTTRSMIWNYCLLQLNARFPCPNYLDGTTREEMLETFLKKYPLALRDRYRKVASEMSDGLHVLNADSKNFVKVEVLPKKLIHKMDPRCISGKHEDYLVESAPEYYFMQKKLCQEFWKDVESIINSGTKYIYTGGMDALQIGLIVSYFESIGWFACEGDFSRYDGHTEAEALAAEFNWYNLTSDTKQALAKQLQTKGRFDSGISVKHKGKVCSGVINTSLGNTVRGFMLFAGYFASIQNEDYAIVQLGDDNMVFTKNKLDLTGLVRFATLCGHKLEIIHRDNYDDLGFCSGYFFRIQPNVRVLTPKVGRVIGKTFVSTDPNMRHDQLGSYVTQIAKGFEMYSWLPVLGEFCQKILESDLSERRYKIKENPYKWTLRNQLTVDMHLVREQFYHIYGFNSDDLSFKDWEPKLGTMLHHPLLTSMLETDGFIDV